VLHRCTSARHAAVYAVTLPPLPPDPPTSVEKKVLSHVTDQEREMMNDLSRRYWEAYNFARAVHDVSADVQPKASARAAYVQVDTIDYELVAKIDADFREPAPVVLSNGVVLKGAPKLRRYPAGTRLPTALTSAASAPPQSLSSLVVPYTWDGLSWARHKKDASIVMYTSSFPHRYPPCLYTPFFRFMLAGTCCLQLLLGLRLLTLQLATPSL
jgi:hypothetical protein